MTTPVWHLPFAAIVLATSVLVGSAQQPTVSTFAPDHPQLFLLFLGQFEAEYGWLDSSGPPHSASERQRAAARFRVREADLPKILAIARTLSQGSQDIMDKMRAHIEQRKAEQKVPDPDTLDGLEAQRLLLQTSAIERCKKELSPESWNGLRSYVNDFIRPRTLTSPRPGSAPPKDY